MDAAATSRVRGVLDALEQTHAEIALEIGSSPDKLSKSLSGTRKFTTTELALIAELGGTTVDWLLTGRQRPTPAIAARSLNSEDPTSAVTGVAKRFSAAHEQLSMLSSEPRPLRALPALPDVWSYVAQATSLAESTTELLLSNGVDIVGSTDLYSEVERALDIDVAVVDLPVGIDGCAWQTSDLRMILLARTSNLARQRFTFAHELEHILAVDAQNLIAESVDHSSLISEKRANSFAASLLVPERAIRDLCEGRPSDARFMEMVNHFRVSPTSLAWRLFNLRLIDREAVARWSELTAEQCLLHSGLADEIVRDRQRGLSPRFPARLITGHLGAYWNGMTSARPLASLLDIRPEQVIESFQPPANLE
ncbi:MAG: ImmA/IrrE family metallo-endopeptidase [Quadrisphaera sp.]